MRKRLDWHIDAKLGPLEVHVQSHICAKSGCDGCFGCFGHIQPKMAHLHSSCSYWGLVMPVLGTPRLGIQVIDLGHLIASWRAQMQSGPSPMHFLRAARYQVL